MGMVKRFLEEYCESQFPDDYEAQDHLFRQLCEGSVTVPVEVMEMAIGEYKSSDKCRSLRTAQVRISAQQDQSYAALRPLLPDIIRISEGNFTENDQELISTLAKMIKCELALRASDADVEGC